MALYDRVLQTEDDIEELQSVADGVNSKITADEITDSSGSGAPSLPYGADTTKVRAYRAGVKQSIPQTTPTLVEYDGETFDTKSEWDTDTYRFTPTEAGYYLCSYKVRWENPNIGIFLGLYLYKNGARVEYNQKLIADTGNDPSQNDTALVYMNGTTDYVQIFCQHNHPIPRDISTGSENTNMSIVRIL